MPIQLIEHATHVRCRRRSLLLDVDVQPGVETAIVLNDLFVSDRTREPWFIGRCARRPPPRVKPTADALYVVCGQHTRLPRRLHTELAGVDEEDGIRFVDRQLAGLVAGKYPDVYGDGGVIKEIWRQRDDGEECTAA